MPRFVVIGGSVASEPKVGLRRVKRHNQGFDFTFPFMERINGFF